MAFRVVSIENPAEVHVANGQLLVEQDDRSVTIPVNDMVMLIVSGPGIRMSTMAQALLADSRVIICHLGRNHHPAALTIPMVANTRQTKVAYQQVGASQELRDLLWQRIVTRKIENQARALAILGVVGAEVESLYTQFRKRLVAGGFVMLQPEVFMRVSPTRIAATHLERRLAEDVPDTGAICMLTLTERQYASMAYLTGKPDRQERLVGARWQVEL